MPNKHFPLHFSHSQLSKPEGIAKTLHLAPLHVLYTQRGFPSCSFQTCLSSASEHQARCVRASVREQAGPRQGPGGCAGQGDAVQWGGCGASTASWLGQDQPGCCEPCGSSYLVPRWSGSRTHTLHFKHGSAFPSPLTLRGQMSRAPALPDTPQGPDPELVQSK